MFTQIKTSKENKEVVALLTRKLGLGTENVIARMAFTYSLAQDKKLALEVSLTDELPDAPHTEIVFEKFVASQKQYLPIRHYSIVIDR